MYRYTHSRVRIVFVAVLGLTVCSSSLTLGQTDITWTGGTGDWTVGSNWSGGLAPEGIFGEQALINNGGVAQLTVPFINDEGAGVLGGPGNLILGQALGDSGTLEISASGDLKLDSGANVIRRIDVGGGSTTTGGTGTLSISGSGRLQGNDIIVGGQASSLLSLQDSATLIADDDLRLRRNTRITGPNVTVTVVDEVTITADASFTSVITGANHSTINSARADIDGALNVEFSGYTPTLGDSWEIINAGTIDGGFTSTNLVSGYALNPGERLLVQNDSGSGVTLSLSQVFTLLVDRGTGEVSIRNEGANSLDIDGYQITSASGGLGGTWNSLSDQAISGWDEAPFASDASLAEVNASGQLTVSGSSLQSLGTPYSPQLLTLPFGQSPDDLQFSYSDPVLGTVVSGEVEYVGDQVFNNLILTIDPNTGDAQISNDSVSFAAPIDGYTITSASGSLVEANWDSLDNQGVEGGTWDDSAPANDDFQLAELNPTVSTSINSVTTFDIGAIFDSISGVQDIEFEFLLSGEDTPRIGQVVYGETTAGGQPGDFDGDLDVDGFDFLLWQRGGSPNPLSASDLADWENNYGASVSAAVSNVPEPATLVSFVVFSALTMVRRDRT